MLLKVQSTFVNLSINVLVNATSLCSFELLLSLEMCKVSLQKVYSNRLSTPDMQDSIIFSKKLLQCPWRHKNGYQ